MRLFLLGATGKTGRELVHQALQRGDEVTAFVRSPEKLVIAHARLTVLKGDPCDANGLAAALPGHDAVICALSSGTLGPSTFPRDSACSLVEAMERTGVQRLVMFSVAFLFPGAGGLLGVLLGRLIFRNVIQSADAMERIVRTSALNWTLVRPPRLTDSPQTGRYRVEDDHLPHKGAWISRADVAEFALMEATACKHLRKIVGVCH